MPVDNIDDYPWSLSHLTSSPTSRGPARPPPPPPRHWSHLYVKNNFPDPLTQSLLSTRLVRLLSLLTNPVKPSFVVQGGKTGGWRGGEGEGKEGGGERKVGLEVGGSHALIKMLKTGELKSKNMSAISDTGKCIDVNHARISQTHIQTPLFQCLLTAGPPQGRGK